MALYLVQHGKNFSKDQDPEQGLTDEGMAEVRRIAGVAKGYRIPVAAIRHSVKKRARQTAEIFAAALLPAGVAPEEITGIKAMDDVAAFAETVDPADNTMYVGHLPFMARLTSLLTAKNSELTVFRFQNGGIVCLDRDEDGGWFIKWTLMPNIG